jgi:pyridoxamine 5'-phosphate oxidase
VTTEPSAVGDFLRHRVQYEVTGLQRQNLAASPLEQFEHWFTEAVAAAVPEPNAMELATIGPDGPQVRVVLAKDVLADGVRFFTNLRSAKAQQIDHDPRVAAVFFWGQAHRQVRLTGTAHLLAPTENEEYFRTRPRDAQIGAWASHQSQRLDSREQLLHRVEELRQRWPEGSEVPLPDHWGGYRIEVRSMEFWQGQPSRLHDRLCFQSLVAGARLDHPGSWRVERLSP